MVSGKKECDNCGECEKFDIAPPCIGPNKDKVVVGWGFGISPCGMMITEEFGNGD